MSDVAIRTAEADDAPFLTDMLVEAANAPDHNRTRADTLADPSIAHYVDGWPRPTDRGVVAVYLDRPVGAAWLRYFRPTSPSYGYVRADIPELVIGVAADQRGRGIGRLLLRALADKARQAGISHISLSVERANPAVTLYQAEGYRVVASRDHAETMLLDLS
jgi:ribosomal protein S18 acetylase RimI-like enzyme